MAIKVQVKKYVMDESLSWEERYKKLEQHHNEETQWLIAELEKRETLTQAAIEMYKVRGWAFTHRIDVHGDKWSKVEKLVYEMMMKGS